ncbi:MAG: DUF3570 domain-containing protein [Deltaproteobacteria bacterium]|nr:DUF3570 domain-containing protein [Deltaproteobacteria bacterium]
MRLQLALAAALALAAPTIAAAEDRAEVSTTFFVESRAGEKGGLTVIHPQALLGFDVGNHVDLAIAYAADAVTGATASVYQADAISSATTFSDFRNEGTLSLGFRGKRSRITFSGTFGVERDYITRAVGGVASIDLPGRNTTVSLAYSHGFDQVCDRGDNNAGSPLAARALIGADPCEKPNLFYGSDHLDEMGVKLTTWRDVTIDTAQATITQNLSPTMNLQVALFGQIQNGFLSNPYRRVRIGSNSPQEHVPATRDRWSLTARVNRYLPRLKGAAHFEARFYDDTWGVIGGNVEMAYSQYLGKPLLVRLFARLYQQTAATFFKDAFFYETEAGAGEFFTGDRELSPVRNVTLGAKLTLITVGGSKPVWGLFDKLQLNLRGEMMLIDVLPANNLDKNPMGIDQQFIYGTSLIDAVTLQLGLLGNY